MRVGSRWFSLEMAAAVCHVGGKIIRSARELIELIGIALELDTDGIWCCLPSEFPSTVSIGKRKFSLIGNILNYFVCKKFTNYQYQTSKHDANGKTILGEYEISAHNSIMFEVDGPYKAMVIPSSTEENRLLKKRYAVFDDNGKITELKGFELKRRGELNIVKKFQEDLFCHFNDGRNLQECYDALAMVCNYWLDIIYKEGGSLDEETVFELFSESRNMSKSLEGYGDRKSNIMSTAKKLSEFLGADILEDKLKCEFIISKYPENAPTAERCIPVLIFKHQEKEKYLKRWLQTGCTDLKKIIDWNYYKRRFEAILQRMVVIPAYFQNISNPVKRVEVPSWIRSVSHGKLDFKKTADIEDLGRSKKKNFADMFYNAECSGLGLPEKSNGGVENDLIKEEAILDDYGAVNEEPCQKKGTKEIPVVLENIKPIIENNRESWLDFYNSRSLILFIDYLDGGSYKLHYFNGSTETVNFTRKVYLEVNDEQHFTEQYEKVEMHLPDSTAQTGLYIMKLNETESKAEKYRKFFEHFSIRNSYNLDSDPFYQLIADCNGGPLPGPCVFISSVIYQRCLIFCITSSNDGTIFISEKKVEQCVNGNSEEVLVPGGNGDVSIAKYTLDAYRKKYVAHVRIISYNGNDPGADEIVTCFKGHVLIRLDLTQTVQLEKIESRLGRQYDLHLKMREEYQKLMDISSLFNIPVKNITPEILEFAYYKEMYGMGFLCLSTPEYSYSVLKDEIVRPGYYPTYTVMLECVSSLLLAIIEYDSVIGEDSLFDGLKKYEFIALREFVRKIVVSSLKGNVGASSLVEKLNYWLKKGSNLISVGLRDLLIVLQQKYLITFVQKLKELQCKIIYVSREIILIDTGKGDLEGCNLYIQYLKNKVNAINGYELLNLEPIRYFEKLGFTGPACYFFVKDGKTFSFSDTTLPMSFCDFYFSGAEITNDQIYAMMPNVNIKQARLLLRLLSYKRDVHGLASNCYRLLRAAETGDSSDEFQSNLTVFCKHCMAEVLMRKRCIRCYEEMEQEYIEEECLKYLYFLWRQQASGDRACNACGAGEERRLKDYCRCGGRFILKNHMKELEMLRLFVNSRKFDNEVNMVNRYFNYK
ncbi:DNA polymerase epsilon subunit 1 [Pancytospora epiphaga]|nr:DNA polymerase epsilon subunit 1 [Pancytospora epiphaga]